MSKILKFFGVLSIVLSSLAVAIPAYAYNSSYESSSSTDPGSIICGAFLIIFYVAIIGFSIYLYWRLTAKTGYKGCYSLLMLVPFVNLIVIIYMAFSEWPIEKELRELKEKLNWKEDQLNKVNETEHKKIEHIEHKKEK